MASPFQKLPLHIYTPLPRPGLSNFSGLHVARAACPRAACPRLYPPPCATHVGDVRHTLCMQMAHISALLLHNATSPLSAVGFTAISRRAGAGRQAAVM